MGVDKFPCSSCGITFIPNAAVPWALLPDIEGGKKGLNCVLEEVVLKGREGEQIVPTFSQSEGIFYSRQGWACVLTRKKN